MFSHTSGAAAALFACLLAPALAQGSASNSTTIQTSASTVRITFPSISARAEALSATNSTSTAATTTTTTTTSNHVVLILVVTVIILLVLASLAKRFIKFKTRQSGKSDSKQNFSQAPPAVYYMQTPPSQMEPRYVSQESLPKPMGSRHASEASGGSIGHNPVRHVQQSDLSSNWGLPVHYQVIPPPQVQLATERKWWEKLL